MWTALGFINLSILGVGLVTIIYGGSPVHAMQLFTKDWQNFALVLPFYFFTFAATRWAFHKIRGTSGVVLQNPGIMHIALASLVTWLTVLLAQTMTKNVFGV